MTDLSPHPPAPPQQDGLAFDGALLARLPRHVTNIVELGCGEGRLGGVYRRFNAMARYIGIENRPEMAELAGRHLHRVIIGNFEQIPFESPTDCIVYNHVLEHMANPAAVLTRHLSALKPDGMVIAAIANPISATNIAALLGGGNRNGGHSTLTLDKLIELFAQCGLSILDISEVPSTDSAPPAFKHHMREAMSALGPAAAAQHSKLDIERFIVRAGRQRPQPLLLHNVTLIPGAGQSQVSEVRVHQPMSFLSSFPSIEVVTQSFREMKLQERSKDIAKICILQRIILSLDWGMNLLKHLVQAGYLIVAEWDDHPDHWPKIAENENLALRGPHALQTSTEPLAQHLRQFTGEVAIFPNQIWDLPPAHTIPRISTVTLFFGALNREQDWAPYMSTLNEVLAERPQLRVEVTHDRKFFDALSTTNKGFTPTCPHADYFRLLDKSDIAFLPLSDTPFNRMKSDLKFIEAAAHGAIALASPIIYEQSIRDGKTGLIFSSPAELKLKLLRLIDDYGLRQFLSETARSYVQNERLMAQHAAKRLEWYRSLIARREELQAQLKQRVPQLFS